MPRINNSLQETNTTDSTYDCNYSSNYDYPSNITITDIYYTILDNSNSNNNNNNTNQPDEL